MPCQSCQNPTLCTERCQAYAEQLKACEASGQMTAQEVSAHVEAGEMPAPRMSRESRAMLLNVLWHHQGGSSPVGQPLRKLLRIGEYDHLTAEQVIEARWIDGLLARAAAPQGGGGRDGSCEGGSECLIGI